MDELLGIPHREETRRELMLDYEFLENYKHSTGHPLIKKVCQHKQNLILQYLSSNIPCYRIGE